MRLQLDEDEADALRRRARIEQRSVQEVPRAAVREYVERHARADADRAATQVMTDFREALDRLGQA